MATHVLQPELSVAIGPRIESFDLWRGVVMVLMALDHVRDFFWNQPFSPSDMDHTYPVLFFTRWITHLCAPSFFFLAGVGIFFAARRRSSDELTRFLVVRGLALIAIEWTLVYWAWSSPVRIWPAPTILVIWTLGMSMIVNGALLRLPHRWIVAISIVMIAGHDLLDHLRVTSSPILAAVWGVLHGPGFYSIPGLPTASGGIRVWYPLVPWIGVMSAGYIFGKMYWERPPATRRRFMARIGVVCLLAFAFLRATNLYGNPAVQDAASSPGEFALQTTLSKTIILFFNVEKYPPSLQFLLMTLGLSLLAIAMVHQDDWEIFEGRRGRIGRIFIVFGKVPMFYYVLHLYLIHGLAIVAALIFRKPVQWLFTSGMFGRIPAEYGFDLSFVYLVWLICIALLYAPCFWYMRYKATHQHRWLGYF